ncbi:SNF2 domain-containing protein CLASSY 3 [Medicago truncatula]|nr:SNF2 domain-containing protein CLASSY 3-like [Medicago truncatula]
MEELAREANNKHSESSYVDVDVDVDDGEEEEEEEEEEDKGEDLSKIWEEFSNGLLEMVREVEDQKCVISETNNVEVNIENSPSSVCNDVSEHADHSNLITFEKKDYFDPVKGCSSSKGNGESKKRESKSVGIKMQNVSNKYDFQFVADQPISFVHSKVHKGESNNANAKAKSKDDAKVYENVNVNVGDSDEGKQKHVKGLGVGGVSSPQAKQEKMRDSDKPKMTENKGGDCKSRFRIRNGEKKESMNNNGLTKMFVPKELCLAKLLAECFWGNKNTMKKDSIVLEVKDGNDDWRDRDTRSPPVCVETPPQIWSLKKVEEVQKTKEELEQEPLWDQMDTALRESEAESMIGNLGTNDMRNPSTLCEHDTCFDDQIGVYCRWCGVVVTEIKYVSQLVMDRFPSEGSGKRASFDDSVNVSHFDGSQFNVSDGEPETNFSHNEGTVWDLIPDDVKETLYPHQLEGFEFIWKNLTGHIDLHKLSKTNPRREGGCIISHAPGTGKTRLTIMFLMSYLKVFPKCLPVIVAPASLLLTWEDEFKKWDIGVPFHNLNNLKLSGKEHDDAVDFVNWSNKRLSKDTTRMVKLISWYKEKSILGISYNLYEKLAGEGGSKRRKKRKHTNVEKRKQNGDMRNALLESPGLLVLDEGHIPRNERSLIWKVLSKIQTRKRIILSGTPFQNNFLELYNILSLVKPSFPNTIPHELKKFCLKQEYKKVSEEWSWEADYGNSTCNPSDHKIKQLKLLMDPFVHVHKGAILQKKLPGIRNCKLTLKPDSLQKQILDSIQSRQNALIFERKLTMASIHPYLFLECDLLKEEESVVDKDQLEKLRLNPYVGVKTKFLVEFVRLCDAVKEKVLVFSQLIRPLCLIIDQLSHISLNWTVGKEILFMHGEVSLKDRQSLIHSFNDANSQAKILLASTNACSEGISLVGASRVVLLDVVWNPSVDRQAISRAYRIGQKKVVYTYHLLTEGTAEKIKHRKQAEKHRLSELVFSAKNADKDKSKSCAVNFEDRILDQLKQHETFKDVFVTVQSKERDLVESFGS